MEAETANRFMPKCPSDERLSRIGRLAQERFGPLGGPRSAVFLDLIEMRAIRPSQAPTVFFGPAIGHRPSFLEIRLAGAKTWRRIRTPVCPLPTLSAYAKILLKTLREACVGPHLPPALRPIVKEIYATDDGSADLLSDLTRSLSLRRRLLARTTLWLIARGRPDIADTSRRILAVLRRTNYAFYRKATDLAEALFLFRDHPYLLGDLERIPVGTACLILAWLGQRQELIDRVGVHEADFDRRLETFAQAYSSFLTTMPKRLKRIPFVIPPGRYLFHPRIFRTLLPEITSRYDSEICNALLPALEKDRHDDLAWLERMCLYVMRSGKGKAFTAFLWRQYGDQGPMRFGRKMSEALRKAIYDLDGVPPFLFFSRSPIPHPADAPDPASALRRTMRFCVMANAERAPKDRRLSDPTPLHIPPEEAIPPSLRPYLVRTKGRLRRIAQTMRNCAANYTEKEGLVHFYRRKTLLQLAWRKRGSRYVFRLNQCYGPANTTTKEAVRLKTLVLSEFLKSAVRHTRRTITVVVPATPRAEAV